MGKSNFGHRYGIAVEKFTQTIQRHTFGEFSEVRDITEKHSNRDFPGTSVKIRTVSLDYS